MTATIEDDLRAGLQAWADGVHPSPGDPHDAMARPAPAGRSARGRPVLWAATAAAAALLTFAVVHARSGPSVVDPAATTTTAPLATSPLSGAFVPVVLTPATDWRLFGVAALADPSQATIEVRHTDDRRIQLMFAAEETWPPGTVWTMGRRVTVHGQTGVAIESGAWVDVVWWEEGRSWSARSRVDGPAHGTAVSAPPNPGPGRAFAGVDELVETLGGLEIVDRATWEHWLPGELATFLRDHPEADRVVWEEGQGIGPDGLHGTR
jgi:hypothetical protein